MKDEDDFELSLGPEISEGSRVAVRRRGGETSLVSLSEMKDGEPLTPGTEIVDIDTRGGPWLKGKTVYRAPLAGGDGPAQVATGAYRDGWGRVFGKKPTVGVA